ELVVQLRTIGPKSSDCREDVTEVLHDSDCPRVHESELVGILEPPVQRVRNWSGIESICGCSVRYVLYVCRVDTEFGETEGTERRDGHNGARMPVEKSFQAFKQAMCH